MTFLEHLRLFIIDLWKDKCTLISITYPIIIPVAAFLCFVIYNGSIVLGDKENHTFTFHWAMLSHSLFLYGFISLPYVFPIIRQFKFTFSSFESKIWNRQVLWFSIVYLMSTYALIMGSRSHPFLLADNRHYTFYIWNRFLKYTHFR